MRHTMRKGLGWLLALTMVWTLVPLEALAAEESGSARETPGLEQAELERVPETEPGNMPELLSEEDCEATLTRAQETDGFTISAEARNSNAFYTEVFASATVPYGSSFQFDWETGQGETVGVNSSGVWSQTNRQFAGDFFGNTGLIDTLPGQTYWYRATLTPMGEDGSLNTAAAVSREGTITALNADLSELTMNGPVTIQEGESSSEQGICFEAPEDGWYRFSVTASSASDGTEGSGQEAGPASFYVWDGEKAGWESAYDSKLVQLTQGAMAYLRISTFPNTTYTIQAARSEQTITEASWELGFGEFTKVSTNGFYINVPVTVKVPIRTDVVITLEGRKEGESEGAPEAWSDYKFFYAEDQEAEHHIWLRGETQPNTDYEYRITLTATSADGEKYTDEGKWTGVESGPPVALSMSVGQLNNVSLSADDPQIVYGSVSVPEQEAGFYKVSAFLENESSGVSVYSWRYNDWGDGNGEWEWSLVEGLVYLEGSGAPYLQLDLGGTAWEEGKTIYPYQVKFEKANIPKLTLGTTEEVTIANSRSDAQYFSFTTAEEGYYQIEVSADSGKNWDLYTWNGSSMDWDYSGSQNSNRQLPRYSANSIQYLRLQGDSGTYQITVGKFNPSVESFTVSPNSSQVEGMGFQMRLPYIAQVVFGSSFSVDLLYTDTNTGRTYRRNVGGMDTYAGEVYQETVVIETVPYTNYDCQLVLTERKGEDAGRVVRSDLFDVWSGEPDGGLLELAPNADGSGYSLTLGGETELYRSEWGIRFTPAQEGWYRISVDNSQRNTLWTWDEEVGAWQPIGDGVLFIGAYETRYLKIQGDFSTAFQVTACPYESDVQNFSIQLGRNETDTKNDGPFSTEILTFVSAPLGSGFRYGIEYREENGTVWWSVEGTCENYPSGWRGSDSFWTNTKPGLSYWVRGFITELRADGSDGETVYSGEGAWIGFTAHELNAVSLSEGKTTIPPSTSGMQYLRFTAKEDGWYLIQTDPSCSIEAWDGETGRWGDGQKDTGTAEDSGSLHLYRLKAGETLDLSMYSEKSCTVTVTKYESKVDAFEVKAQEPRLVNGFLAKVPVSIAAPLGSSFRACVEYRAAGAAGLSSAVLGEFANNTSENMELTALLQTAPGTNYEYRICLTDPTGNDLCRYPEASDGWLTFQSPQDDAAAVEVQVEDTLALFQDYDTGEALFRFTAKEAGDYLLLVMGLDRGILWTWDPVNAAWVGRELSSWEEQCFTLEAGSTRYFRLDMGNVEGCQVLFSRYQWGLTAKWEDSAKTTLCAAAQVKDDGRYLFAIYDGEGRCLDLRSVKKHSAEAETVSAVFTGAGRAREARVFHVSDDGAFIPLSPAEMTKVK